MATKLYLHASTSVPSGTLPTTEQSALTSVNDFEANQATNRVMNTTIGVSQTSLANASQADTNANDYYIARWVSPIIWQGTISANTWDYKSAMQESNANANFPRNGAGALYVNCYVWNLRTGTKVGTILDGATAADGEEAGTGETLIECTFTGAAVSGIEPGQCVIVFEAWARTTQGNGTSRTQTFYFDGTTESSTTTNAAHISTPEDLQFSQTDGNMTVMGAAFTGISTANTTQYLPISGSWGSNNFTTTEAEVQIPIRTAGVLSKLAVRVTGYSVSAGGSTYTVRKNGVDTGLVLTFSGTGYHEDLVNTVSVAAGDLISIKTVPGGATGTWTHKTLRLHFTADDGTTTAILGCTEPNSIVNNSATRFYPIVGRLTNTNTEINCKVEQRIAGKYSKLAVYVQSNARTTSTTFKSRVNGADGNLSVTYAAGETGLKEDTSNEDTVSVGDDYNFAITTGSGASESIVPFFMKTEFVSTEFKGILSTGNTGSSNQTTANETREMALIGAANPLVTTTDYRAKIRHSRMILSDLQVYAMTNTVTADSTVRLLVNGTASALTCTVTNATTGLFTDNTHVVEVGSNDELSVQIIAGATGTVLGTGSVQIYYHTGRLNEEYTHKYHIKNLVQAPSLLFDGTNDYIDCGNHSDLWSQGLTKFSWSIWVYPTGTGNSRVIINHNGGSAHGFRAYLDTTGGTGAADVIFNCYDSVSTLKQSSANNTLVMDAWNQIVGVYDSTLGSQNVKVYVNKVVGGTTANLTETMNNSSVLELSLNTNDFQGNMKDFRFFKSIALTQTEIDNIYANNSSAPVPDYYLPMNEGTGTPVDIIKGKTTTLPSGGTWEYNSPVQLRGKVFTHKWNIRNLIADTFTHIYDILESVTLVAQTYTHKYNIKNLAAGIFTHKWNIRNLASDTFTHIWNIKNLIADTFTHKYNIKNLISNTYTHIANIKNLISDTFTHKWNIRNLISSTYTHKWNIKNLIAQTYTHIYDILTTVLMAAQTYTHKYNIRNLATGTYTHKWNIRNLATGIFTHKYNIRNLATGIFTHKWNIRNLANKVFTHKWNIKNLINQIFTHKYNIKNLIAKTYTHIYDILQTVGVAVQSYTHKYNIRNLTSQTYTHKWNIKTLINQIYTHKYGIKALINQIFTHKYGIKNLIAKIYTHKYGIRNLTSKTFTHFYDILEMLHVSQTFTHIYSILGNPVTIQRIGGKPSSGNVWREKYIKQREQWTKTWKIDYKAKFDKMIKDRLKKLGK